MRTEDASDLFGGLIDACGRDAAKARKPDGIGRHWVKTGFPNDRVGHLRTASSNYFKLTIISRREKRFGKVEQ